MAIRHLSYLDLSPLRRSQHGSAMLKDLHRALAMPGLMPAMRHEIQVKIDAVNGWIEGTTPTRQFTLKPPPVVELSDDDVVADPEPKSEP